MDDESSLREIFGRWLTAAGCMKLLTAADGESALAVIRENRVDALVTDIRMPVMDGVTLVRRLAEVGWTVPSMIFVSGFGTVDTKEMYALGVEAFLAKPLRREELLEAVERALTDRSSLWLTPLAAVPRQSVSIEADGIGEASGPDSIRLGRGGLSAHYGGWVSLGKLGFTCLILGNQVSIRGQGIVRWHSKSEKTLGIEFVWLDAACREQIIEQIGVIRPRSLIPSF